LTWSSAAKTNEQKCATLATANPNIEIRNPKQIRIFQTQMTKTEDAGLALAAMSKRGL
jgi:hypothetical protein